MDHSKARLEDHFGKSERGLSDYGYFEWHELRRFRVRRLSHLGEMERLPVGRRTWRQCETEETPKSEWRQILRHEELPIQPPGMVGADVEDKVIIERERYWKDVLQSRQHGYNEN